MDARRPDGERVAPRDQDGHSNIGRVATILTLGLLLATACSALAPFHWLGDAAAHFPVQYAVLALVAFLVLAWLRRMRWAAVAFVVAAINITICAPEFSSGAAATSAPGGIPFRAVAVNVLYRNQQYPRVIDFVRAENADFVTFVEVEERWSRALRALEDIYPHRFETRGTSGRGVLLLSRWPLENATSLALPAAGEPAIEATVQIAGRRVKVLAVHTSWPMGALRSRERNDQLSTLAREVRNRTQPLVLLGDLNLSPFSPHFDALLEEAGLRSAAAGFGWQPTWPTFFPPAGIPIDHVLISSDVAVRDFRRGPPVGSDHWPVVADLVLPAG